MKKGWQIKPLGEIANVSAGNSAPQDASLFDGGIHPFFRTSDIGRVRFGNISDAADHLNDDGIRGLRRFPAGTILFPKSGASTFLNHRVMLSVDGFVSSHLATIAVDSERANARFVLFYLSTVAAQDLIQDHAYPSLNLPAISAIPIPLPPLPEQKRIVGILDEAFAGIATAKENAERNLQNARDLFESHLNAVFSQRGEGWVEKRLGDLCEIKTGKKDVNEGNPEGQYPFFTCAAQHTYSDSYSFDTEALLVAGNGNVGQVSYYSGRFEAYQRTYVLFGFRGVTGKYLFRVLDKRLSASVGKQKLGNTMPYIKLGMLTEFAVPVPPVQAQVLLQTGLDNVAAEAALLESIYQQKLAALDALKKSLLHRAFEGEL